jgi:hypothetical protein
MLVIFTSFLVLGKWGGSHCASGLEKQIPFGNDKQRRTGNGKYNSRFPAGMTRARNDKKRE